MILDKKITKINAKGHLLVDTRPWIDNQFIITGWEEGVCFYLKNLDCWQQENIDPGLVLISKEHLDSSLDKSLDGIEPLAEYLNKYLMRSSSKLNPISISSLLCLITCFKMKICVIFSVILHILSG